MHPAELAALALNIDPRDVQRVEPIKHGLTNESWVVTSPVEQVVVRISRADAATLQIDRHSERAILLAAARAGIGPDVLHCDPSSGALVTRYLGDTWTDADASQPRNIVRLAQLMSKLHALPPPREAHRVDWIQVLDGYLRELDARGWNDARGRLELRRRAYDSARSLHANAPLKLCHNDVHALNVIDSGNLRLIDWEYAGLGDPIFDLASICIYQRFDRAQRQQLLSAYAQASSSVSEERLQQACWLFDYIRDLWLAVRTGVRFATASNEH